MRSPARIDGPTDLEHDLQHVIHGDVRFDSGSRALYATDGSNYRQVPIGVVIPRDADDVVAAVSVCRKHGAPLLSRGGGTSLAGQCCNVAVVLDMSKYFNRVLGVDDQRRVARVEPGVVLDRLREHANGRGLTFGPDPATHTHCTLGGMLGNNSCGVHSVFSEFYGPGPRTSDHVEELDVLTYRGQRLRARATDAVELRRVHDLGGELGAIYDQVLALRDRHADLIRSRFPDMPRRVSGYNLPDLLDDHGCHIGRALVGSESTCVVILGARLTLMPARPVRVLTVLGYPDIYAAAAAASAARELRPIGCEAMDEVLVNRVRRQRRDRHHALALLP
jgi:FAD/FMN-containing dehydrogenase